MKNRGFTLIELLAVIVILAIIALIATPIILSIINDTKQSADERSIELYGKSVENAVAKYQMLYPEDTNITFNKISSYIEYEGNPVSCTYPVIYKEGYIYLSQCKVNGKEIDYDYGTYRSSPEEWFECSDNGDGTCALDGFSDDSLLVNVTDLVIPDTIDGLKVTSISSGAFVRTGKSTLTSLVMPKSVTSIGSAAFISMIPSESLELVITPNGASISEDAFTGHESTNLVIYYSGNAEGAPWGATNATIITE